jgi:VWFA-related protein
MDGLRNAHAESFGWYIDDVQISPPPLCGISLGISSTEGGLVGVASESIGSESVVGPGKTKTFTFEYGEGSFVGLTAVPEPNYVFSGWAGLALCDPNEGRTDLVVRMDQSMSLTAHFSNLIVSITDVNDAHCPTREAVVMVTDTNGTAVTGLDKSNFTVYENRSALSQDSIEVVPGAAFVSVCLCLDFSSSMDDKHPSDPCVPLEAMKSAAKIFIDAMKEPGDRVAIVKFADGNEISQEYTPVKDAQVKDELKKIIDQSTSLSRDSTSLYDAICTAISLTSGQPGSRAVVVITDGVDNSSDRCEPSEVIEHAREAGIPVCIIGLGSQMDMLVPGSETETVGELLERIATATEGRYRFAPLPSDLEEIYLEISEALNEQYLVIYPSGQCIPAGGDGSQPQELRIEVHSDGLSGRDVICLPRLPL